MAVGLADAAAPAATGTPVPPPADPPAQWHARHRRPWDLPAVVDRSWRLPLALAVAIFAACGPAQALGHTDLVYFAVLIGLALGAVAIPFGLLALRLEKRADGAGSAEEVESRA